MNRLQKLQVEPGTSSFRYHGKLEMLTRRRFLSCSAIGSLLRSIAHRLLKAFTTQDLPVRDLSWRSGWGGALLGSVLGRFFATGAASSLRSDIRRPFACISVHILLIEAASAMRLNSPFRKAMRSSAVVKTPWLIGEHRIADLRRSSWLSSGCSPACCISSAKSAESCNARELAFRPDIIDQGLQGY